MNGPASSSPMSGERLIVMGRVRGAFGVKGWIKVDPFTERSDGLGQFSHWWLRCGEPKRGEEWRRVQVEEWASHGAHLVARLADCTDRDAAAALSGADIAVPRDSLPQTADNELYQADLIGLEVRNRADELLGRVETVFDNGAHEVMSVRWEGGERLIPFIATVVDAVEVDAGVIRVDWGVDW